MLTEMDGMDAKRQVFVIAATNRPDMIDPAMLRPGRLDKLVFVPLPTADAREEILRTATRRMPLGEDVALGAVARDARCGGFSGADLSSLAREAAVGALKDCVDGMAVPKVSMAHFARAFDAVQPSVSPQDEQRYRRLAERLRRTRAEGKSGGGGGGQGGGEDGAAAAAPTPGE